uniref:Uncharacterized protein n=1 Tax=Anguilla anguilla TaxID=7936 RepID=A0A0E9XEU8_ANGAN
MNSTAIGRDSIWLKTTSFRAFVSCQCPSQFVTNRKYSGKICCKFCFAIFLSLLLLVLHLHSSEIINVPSF